MEAVARINRDHRDERIAELEEEVRQLRDLAFSAPLIPPQAWSLSAHETALLRLLVKRHVVNDEVFAMAVTDTQSNSLHVYVYKLRKKLGQYGIEILNRFGSGYSLSAAMRQAVTDACTSGSPVVGEPVRHPGKTPLTPDLLAYVNAHPDGVTVRMAADHFRGRAGIGPTLYGLAGRGLVRRYKHQGTQRCFVFYPLNAGLNVSACLPTKERAA